MEHTIDHSCIVILAAGQSKRLGSPKQLLEFKGKSLLQHAVSSAMDTGIKPVIVITGARFEKMQEVLEQFPVQLIYNKEWEEGMAASIRCGVEGALQMNPDTDGILFMVCDQPFTDSSVLNELIVLQKETGTPITASFYEDIIGTPALYHKSIFPELLSLQGDIGAKKIISKYKDSISTITFNAGKTDIDTINDYENLLKTIQ